MRTFIQLKDGIAFAFVNTDGEIQGGIEIENGTGEFYINKSYSNGSWSDSVAPLICYAEVLENGTIVEIKRTRFASAVDGPVMNSDTGPNHKWINNAWVAPPIEVVPVEEA